MKNGSILFGIAGSLLATPAFSALTLHTAPFIVTPVASSGLEDLSDNVAFNSIQTTGGLTIEYIWANPFEPCCMATGAGTGVSGSKGWYAIDYEGFTSLKLADGSAFNQIQFAASSGGDSGPIQYSLWLGGAEVANGLGGTVPANSDPFTFTTLGFSGIEFDEVRLRLDRDAASFMLTDEDILALDNIAIGRAIVSPIPEPTTWAMMILGFGLMRRSWRRAAITRQSSPLTKPAQPLP